MTVTTGRYNIYKNFTKYEMKKDTRSIVVIKNNNYL